MPEIHIFFLPVFMKKIEMKNVNILLKHDVNLGGKKQAEN